MRILIGAALAASTLTAIPAIAQTPWQSQREYNRDVRDAQRDYRRDLRHADSRHDVRRAQREYHRDIRDARQDYRRDARNCSGITATITTATSRASAPITPTAIIATAAITSRARWDGTTASIAAITGAITAVAATARPA